MKKCRIAAAAVALAITAVSSVKAEINLKTGAALRSLEAQAVDAGVDVKAVKAVPKVAGKKKVTTVKKDEENPRFVSGPVSASRGGPFTTMGEVGSGGSHLSLGDGYNTMADFQAHPECLEALNHEGTNGKTYSEMVHDLHEFVFYDSVDSVSSVDSRRQIGASVEGKWVVSSLEGALDLQDTRHEDHNGVDLVGVVAIGLGEEVLKRAYLHPQYLALLKQQPDRFIRRCGDMYVRGLEKGGSLRAVIHIRANGASDKKTLDTHFKGSGWGINASAKFNSEITEAQKDHHVTITYVISGGPTVTIDNDPDAIRSFLNTANTFIKGINEQNAKTIAYDLYSYTNVQNYDGTQARAHLKN
jgi:hypothetical protein